MFSNLKNAVDEVFKFKPAITHFTEFPQSIAKKSKVFIGDKFEIEDNYSGNSKAYVAFLNMIKAIAIKNP